MSNSKAEKPQSSTYVEADFSDGRDGGGNNDGVRGDQLVCHQQQEKEELESQRLTKWGPKKCTWNVLLMLRRGRSRPSSRSRSSSRRRRTRTRTRSKRRSSRRARG